MTIIFWFNVDKACYSQYINFALCVKIESKLTLVSTQALYILEKTLGSGMNII